MAHTRPDNCLVLRDGTSYLLLRDRLSALSLRDLQGVGGSGMSGGTFSRRRWNALKDEEERKRQAARDERGREQTRKAETDHAGRAKARAEVKAKAEADRAPLEAHGRALRQLFRGQAAQA